MLILVILFLVVMGVSFVLAFRSMNDYRETPVSSVSFSVFLVGNPQQYFSQASVDEDIVL